VSDTRRTMFAVTSDLETLSETCRVLPRYREFPNVWINFDSAMVGTSSPLTNALAALEAGTAHQAYEEVRRVPQDFDAIEMLAAGAIALKANAVNEAITYLEPVALGPVVQEPPGDAAVVLSFTDVGLIMLSANSLAAIGLLIYAYARAGRGREATELAAATYRASRAEGFLALQLMLLRDAKAWDALLDAADERDRDDRGRFEIELLRAEAFEALERPGDALEIYDELAALSQLADTELTWFTEAIERRSRLGRSASNIPDPGDAEVTGPLRTSTSGTYAFDPSGLSSGRVVVSSFREGAPPGTADAWIIQGQEESPAAALDALERASETDYTPALGALLAAAAEHADAVVRLTAALEDPGLARFVSNLARWTEAYVFAYIGDCMIALGDGADVFVIALAARLYSDGEPEAARRWVTWARASGDSVGLQVADVGLALAASDMDAVFDGTSQVDAENPAAPVLIALRARALEREDRDDAAILAYNDALRYADRLGEDSEENMLAIRFARAQLFLQRGERDRALGDLRVIEATDPRYPGIEELLDGAVGSAQPTRGRPDREMRRAVYERDEGRCAVCGSQFDLQYDHVLPVALGGATSVENLQLLCGECNQRKGKNL